MGGNEPTFKISVNKYVQNLNLITDQIIAKGIQVVWSSTIPGGFGSNKNNEYKPYAQAFLQIPDKKNLMKIDMFHLYKQFPLERIFTFKSEENPIEGIKQGEPDLQHPNQLGNAYIAKVILEKVFNISFNPELYINNTLAGEKYPRF